jgi:hypothetical protein
MSLPLVIMNILIFFSLLIVCIGSAFIESIRNIPLPLVYAGLSRHKEVVKQSADRLKMSNRGELSISSQVMNVSKKNQWKDWYSAAVVARGVAR